MSRLRWTLLILLLMLIPTASRYTVSSAQETEEAESCAVSENYREAVQENQFSLLKVLSMAHAADSPLQRDSGFGSYYMMLLSTRHYHEAQHETLPDCARSLNQAYIETIAASQDVMALTMAWQENPETDRYEDRLAQAIDHLDQQWQELAERTEETPLVGQESE